MASLREIRRKIKSVKSTEQITKAMKMVAAARMRRSQLSILAARPFAIKMERLVRELALLEIRAEQAAGLPLDIHPFFNRRPQSGAELIVFVTGDKGLCGAFNSNVLRAAIDWFRARKGRKSYCVVVGRKGRDFVHRLKGADVEVIQELAGVFPKVSFAHAELVGQAVIDAYLDPTKSVSKVTVLYNEFKSVAQQRLLTVALLPIPEPEVVPAEIALPDYGFEPGRQELLGALLPRHVKASLYRILLESQAAELAARMNAMDAASKNAKELREALNLDANRTRQSFITKEIAELVGGAEALAN
ncbi:MAG TPA: ATP synthase F1 subunit gamma [Elusimicrobia bacterium]|nr:MAG: ATP synthase F1 subunit gamma [Elusimicrobia bacterium GWA2_66_18]OGR71943.1 MAG: ATP synthase F1 subunit gamma [Elusimicrobia bacterium GWC2_65_9]HAZ08990.1 ATP synthase F1 subunit gamma [Elusimicrobiota bacterium]